MSALPHRWSVSQNFLAGITADAWWRLLRDNAFAVSPAYWHRAAVISGLSLVNSWNAGLEARRFGDAIAATRLERPPLFILGHWRSGTTHLHNLLSQDPRFAYANTFQAVNPSTFLTTEAAITPRFGWMVPARRLMDNVALSFSSPAEEEYAPAMLSLCSPYLGMSFPGRAAHYDRFLTFDTASDEEREVWKASVLEFCRKLTFHYGPQRPLILKSPPNTARVRLLLELFPDARFVHIHRHPYEVYRSQLHFDDTMLWHLYLQRPDRERLSAGVLARYRRIFEALYRDVPLIPDGQLHELSFDDLERDPVGEVKRCYEALRMEGFEAVVRPPLEAYVASIRSYRKNAFAPLDPAVRSRIDEAAAPWFERWGYATGETPPPDRA